VREPYETLLGCYREHWLLWPFLDGEVPDWSGIMGAGPLGQLSDGELIVLHVALAIWNGDRTARIADLAHLDLENRRRVLGALTMAALGADA
jgi:hypothetical protein